MDTPIEVVLHREFGAFWVERADNHERSETVQTDWDYPGFAESLGWNPGWDWMNNSGNLRVLSVAIQQAGHWLYESEGETFAISKETWETIKERRQS